MANYCSDCAYHGKCAGMICCNYLEKTGTMRPCNPGDGCTVKIKFRERNYQLRKKVEK